MNPNNGTLSIAQKFKLLRESKGITQADIAELLSTNQGKISRIEQGKEEYADFDVKTLRKRFDVVGMPLEVGERKDFRVKLYHWRNLIRNRQINEAKELQDKIKNIANLKPCDFDLYTLYRLFEALLYIAENNVFTAGDILDDLKPTIDIMTPEHKYYFDFHMGSFYVAGGGFEKALEYYRKALATKKANKGIIPDSEERICHNIALCYTDLEQLSRAIMFLAKIPEATYENNTTTYSMGIDIMRAINYYKIGEYEEAEEILNDCLSRAKSVDNELYIGLSLQNLGKLHKYSKNWGKATEYFDKALNHFEKNTYYHAWALYYKFRCMIETTKLNALERELIDIAESLEGNDNYTIFLETLRYTIYLNRNMSRYNVTAVEYIETVSIPYFIKTSNRLDALECYKLLERHFIRNKQQKKSLEANRGMLEIHERMV
ncbi:MAG: helix-turn-helix transcriptional regulator [Defluviitaleaceae bacterium]|nr:helix-turn-helix transcriptional regulator [Defluviitaleaceae bacterium]